MFFTRLKVSGDGRDITCFRSQPERDNILHTLERRRIEGVAPRDVEGLGRMVLQIPWEDFERLKLKYPDLGSPDGKVKTRAYYRFMASDESLPFRVRERC
jgi:hypothetical protein